MRRGSDRMDFSPSPVQKELRQLARRFAEKELTPLIEEDERTETFRPEIIQKLGALGLTGVATPEAWGGAGLGYSEYALVIEELARISASYAISVSVSGLPQLILNQFGTEAQKKRWIPRLAQGLAIGSFSLSEAFSGSDAASLKTTATKKGKSYLLQGTKQWTTQADSAEVILLMARTGASGPAGISAFVLEKGMPGLSFGKRERKMGCHISHTMELLLEGVEVPEENRVGSEGEGFKIAMTALDSGRITIAASALGISKAALEVASNHARIREQFGKTIGEFQGISFLLADHATQWSAAELLVRKAAWRRDQGLPFSTEAAMAKLFCTDMAMSACTDAVQVLGGSGYTQDFPVERYMREAKVLQIVEGTNQIQRLVIGRTLLKDARAWEAFTYDA